MPGIRITHRSEHDVDYALPLLDTPLTAPLYCHRCDTTYTTKHLHLLLDTQGSVIVSPEIAATITDEYTSTGFTRGNVVNDPPAQGIRSGLLENEKRRNPDLFRPVKRGRGRRKK